MKYRLLLCVWVLLTLCACGSHRPLTAEEKARIEAEVDAIWEAEMAKVKAEQLAEQAAREALVLQQNLKTEVRSWIGTPYRLGGNSRRGVDCSGLVCQVFQNVYGKKMHRRSEDQYKHDIARYLDGNQLQIGDLVFFATGRRKTVNHVGIYLGDYRFIHAATSGVRIDDLRSRYFVKYWVAGGTPK